MSHPNFLHKLLNLVHMQLYGSYVTSNQADFLHFDEQIAYLFEMWYFIELSLYSSVHVRQPLVGWNNPKIFTVYIYWNTDTAQ